MFSKLGIIFKSDNSALIHLLTATIIGVAYGTGMLGQVVLMSTFSFMLFGLAGILYGCALQNKSK